jgi:glutamate synthase (NADPH/NADH) small chain
LLYKGKWAEAYNLMLKTNNFPEFTGRVCPALCEKSCVLNLEHQALTTRENEVAIVERAFLEGYIKPNPPKKRTGKKVAVIGSGPAGLAAADQLNKAGHTVTVYEKDEYIGGLMRLGIPDFKFNKEIIERRLDLLKAEGIVFETGVEAGKDVPADQLLGKYDALCLAIGAGVPRDLPIEGRELKGVHFALELLKQQNRIVAGQSFPAAQLVSAKGKKVLVIGGGDTGSDCVGTSIRQKATKVTQIEIMPMPPKDDNPATPWPNYPNILKTSTSHEEGCERRWSLASKRFIGEKGKVSGVEVQTVEWTTGEDGRPTMKEVGKTEIIPADIVFLCMGFTQPVHEGLLDALGVKYDGRGNVQAVKPNESSVAKVFVAGDVTSGASLVVRGIASGRAAAARIGDCLLHS